jgi:hypothetical protein
VRTARSSSLYRDGRGRINAASIVFYPFVDPRDLFRLIELAPADKNLQRSVSFKIRSTGALNEAPGHGIKYLL